VSVSTVAKVRAFAGGGLTVWTSSSTPQTISARRIHTEMNEVPAAVVISGSSTTASSPELAVDPQGQSAIAVWQQVDPFAHNIYAAHIVKGGTFGAPIRISDGASNAAHAAVSMDARGNALAVWDQSEPEGSSIRASRFDRVAGAWNTPVTISDTASHDLAQNPLVTVERGGNALVLYQEARSDGTAIAAVTARYLAGQGFVPAQRRALSPMGAKVVTIGLGSDDLGHAFAAWNADSAVWVSRFQ
jgi:hypothetical protein